MPIQPSSPSVGGKLEAFGEALTKFMREHPQKRMRVADHTRASMLARFSDLCLAIHKAEDISHE